MSRVRRTNAFHEEMPSMPFFTVLKSFLTGLKLSPTESFTRHLLTLLKLTTLAGAAIATLGSLTRIPDQYTTPLRV